MESEPLSSLTVKEKIFRDNLNANYFVSIIIVFVLTNLSLNWTLLYALRFQNSTAYERLMKVALSVAILDLVFLMVLIFALFIVWRYDHWEYISQTDRVTYVVWLILTATTFIAAVINFWTYANLKGTITDEKLKNAKDGALWATSIFTAGFTVIILTYAIRGYKSQLDNGLFVRNIKAMKEARMKELQMM